jgi:hypothetical protein
VTRPSVPPGYPGYLPDDALPAEATGFGAHDDQPYVDALDPNDPLVNPPADGLDGWWRRLGTVLALNWRVLLPVALICYGVPGLLGYGLFGALPARTGVSGTSLLLGLLVSALGTAVGWGALTWTAVQRAVGIPPTVSGALVYGFRRSPRLIGLQLLVVVMIGIGLVLLVLPGLYFAYALCLVMPAALLRQQNPVGASFGLTHRNIGRVLSRIAPLLAAVVACGVAVLAARFLIGASPGWPAQAAVAVARGLIWIPAQLVFTVGLLLTHIEMTARSAPITSASLHAAL